MGQNESIVDTTSQTKANQPTQQTRQDRTSYVPHTAAVVTSSSVLPISVPRPSALPSSTQQVTFLPSSIATIRSAPLHPSQSTFHPSFTSAHPIAAAAVPMVDAQPARELASAPLPTGRPVRAKVIARTQPTMATVATATMDAPVTPSYHPPITGDSLRSHAALFVQPHESHASRLRQQLKTIEENLRRHELEGQIMQMQHQEILMQNQHVHIQQLQHHQSASLSSAPTPARFDAEHAAKKLRMNAEGEYATGPMVDYVPTDAAAHISTATNVPNLSTAANPFLSPQLAPYQFTPLSPPNYTPFPITPTMDPSDPVIPFSPNQAAYGGDSFQSIRDVSSKPTASIDEEKEFDPDMLFSSDPDDVILDSSGGSVAGMGGAGPGSIASGASTDRPMSVYSDISSSPELTVERISKAFLDNFLDSDVLLRLDEARAQRLITTDELQRALRTITSTLEERDQQELLKQFEKITIQSSGKEVCERDGEYDAKMMKFITAPGILAYSQAPTRIDISPQEPAEDDMDGVARIRLTMTVACNNVAPCNPSSISCPSTAAASVATLASTSTLCAIPSVPALPSASSGTKRKAECDHESDEILPTSGVPKLHIPTWSENVFGIVHGVTTDTIMTCNAQMSHESMQSPPDLESPSQSQSHQSSTSQPSDSIHSPAAERHFQANRSFTRLLGYTQSDLVSLMEELQERVIFKIIRADHLKAFHRILMENRMNSIHDEVLYVVHLAKDGTEVYCRTQLSVRTHPLPHNGIFKQGMFIQGVHSLHPLPLSSAPPFHEGQDLDCDTLKYGYNQTTKQ